jgi:hypothetical protein
MPRKPRPKGKPKGAPRGKDKPFTADQQRVFLQLVSATMYPSVAARHVGVTPQAISNRKRLDEGFLIAFERADATAEFNLVAIVLRAAQKDWRAAMRLLESRWPERWGRPEVRASFTKGDASKDMAEQMVGLLQAAVLTMPLPDFADGAQPQKVAEPAGDAEDAKPA